MGEGALLGCARAHTELEMAQQVRAEDTDFIPRIHTVAHNYAHIIPVPGDLTLFSDF